MQITTFKLSSGRTLVAGLLWQPISGPEKTFKSELANLGKQLSCNLAVIRRGAVNQAGYASESDGVKAGWCSIAAIISKAIEKDRGEPSFLCATNLPDGRWVYVAQRDGSILPDADFIATEAEVKSRILSDFSLAAWEVIYAPKSWNLPKSIERSFLSIIPASGGEITKYRVEYVNANFSTVIKKWLIIFIVTLSLGVVSSFLYKQHQSSLAEQVRLAAVAKEAATAAASAIPNPWEIKPTSKSFVTSCLTSLNGVPLTPGGWVVDDAICDDKGLIVSWVRPIYSTIKLLKLQVPLVVIDITGDKATLTLPVKFSGGVKEDIPSSAFARELILTKSQQIDTKVTIIDSPPPHPLPGALPENGQGLIWHEMKWSFSSQLSPIAMSDMFGGAGFRTQKITLKVRNGRAEWTMEGIQYVKS